MPSQVHSHYVQEQKYALHMYEKIGSEEQFPGVKQYNNPRTTDFHLNYVQHKPSYFTHNQLSVQ
jgi:hypothetical protein